MSCQARSQTGRYGVSSPWSTAGVLQRSALGGVCAGQHSRVSCEGIAQCQWVPAARDEEDNAPQAPIVNEPPTPPEKVWWTYAWIGLACFAVLVVVVSMVITHKNTAHLNDTAGDDIDLEHDPALERDDLPDIAV